MQLTLGTRFSVAIIGVIALAAASSLLTLVSMWAVGNLMQEVLTNNVPSVPRCRRAGNRAPATGGDRVRVYPGWR